MPKRPSKPLDRIMISLRLKQPTSGLTREQAMNAWPIRNPALTVHDNEDGTVTVELPRRKDWVGGVLGFMFSVPESKPVQLDEIGTMVWSLCDGDHTVNDIAAELAREHKVTRREMEMSLTEYLQKLGKRGMIAFAIPRDVAEAAGIKGTAIPAQPTPEDFADQEQEEAAEPPLEK